MADPQISRETEEDVGEVFEILETYTVEGTGELKVEYLSSEENVLMKIKQQEFNKLLSMGVIAVQTEELTLRDSELRMGEHHGEMTPRKYWQTNQV